jgi:aryl-phospho-beta-D-glucosidase BglC (GH1 family)
VFRGNNIKVLIDLHAVPGSQNGQEHSATIDGVAAWATGKDIDGTSYIDLSLKTIEFLAERSVFPAIRLYVPFSLL